MSPTPAYWSLFIEHQGRKGLHEDLVMVAMKAPWWLITAALIQDENGLGQPWGKSHTLTVHGLCALADCEDVDAVALCAPNVVLLGDYCFSRLGLKFLWLIVVKQGLCDRPFPILRGQEVKCNLSFPVHDLIWVASPQLLYVLFLLSFGIPTPFWDNVVSLS